MIGILGGTFDPIHFGHLRLALEAQQQLNLQEVRFIPCQQQVLKPTTKTSAEHRLEMLRLAINNQSKFIVDKREIERSTPSYSYDTLTSLRAEFPNHPLGFIIGSDALARFSQWHRWDELIQLTHLIIAKRPNYEFTLTSEVKEYLDKYVTNDPHVLQQQTHGYIYFQEITALDISATEIRNLVQLGKSARYLLPENVLEYIEKNQLY